MQPAQRLVKSHAVCVLLEGSRFCLASRALGLFFSCCPWNVIDLILLDQQIPFIPGTASVEGILGFTSPECAFVSPASILDDCI